MNEINSAIRENLLNRTLESWNRWTFPEKPRAFWIREYELKKSHRSMESEIEPLTWARRVWSLDKAGLALRNPLDWRRFEILIRDFGVAPFHRGTHEIGKGCFAPLSEKGFFYYEEIWGGLHGSGYKLNISEAGEILGNQMVWIS